MAKGAASRQKVGSLLAKTNYIGAVILFIFSSGLLEASETFSFSSGGKPIQMRQPRGAS